MQGGGSWTSAHSPTHHGRLTKQDTKRRLGPRPSVPDPRRHLLSVVLAFVRAARSSPGVLWIALLGSLATDKPVPKDADVLVTIDATVGSCFSRSPQTAPQGRSADDQSGRRHLPRRRGQLLPRPHLPLPRVPRTRDLPGAPLRPAATPERRPSGRHAMPRAHQRSTHRTVAAHCHALNGSASSGGAGEGWDA